MIKATFYVKDFMASLARFNQTIEIQKTQVPMFMASDYVNSIRNNIVTQKYSFIKYNDDYAAWKQKKVGHLAFFKLSGKLLKETQSSKVRITKNTATYFGGVKGEQARYGKIVEDGTYGKNKESKPRRLFSRTFDDYIQKEALERVNRAGDMLRSIWR